MCRCLIRFSPNAYTHAGKSSSTLSGRVLGGRLDGTSGTLEFPLECRVSLMLTTMLVAAVGVNRTLLRRLVGGWAFALAFRRKVFASLDVSHTAATSLPPSRRCRVNGALLDELLLVTRLAPLLQTNLRAEPCEKHYATDASPSGAGDCVAPITQEAWLALYDLAEEKEKPPSNMHDGRTAAAPLALRTLFSYRLFDGKREWEQYCYDTQGNACAFSEGCSQDPDAAHAGFYGVAVLIRMTLGGVHRSWSLAIPAEFSAS